MIRWLLAAVAAAGLVPAARADVKVHPLFSDNMVLQRGVPVTVFGKAAPGESVVVNIVRQTAAGSATAAGDGKADAAGNWTVTIVAQQAAGTGYTLTIEGVGGKDKTTFQNVAVGDVWVCSGQSNMEWKLAGLTKDEQGKKVSAAAANPMIRLFTVPNRPAATPQDDFPVSKTEGVWLECTPDTAINFSAVGYFFGRDIQKDQKVPVGLISSDWGGTPAEAWTSLGALEAVPDLKHYAEKVETVKKNYDPAKAKTDYEAALAKWNAAAEQAKKDGKPAPGGRPQQTWPGGVNQNSPTALYNGMIHPIQRFAVKGAIWYQGESNASRAAEYRSLFPAMIADWRKQWGTDLPFFAVQLAPFKGGASGLDYAELRDAQFFATVKLPKVGLAVITDVGEENDIHPQKKEPVGQRLALAARAIAYDQKIEYSGPVYKAMKAEGNKVMLTFDHVGGGLVAKDGPLAGFAVCGADKVFHPATAEVVGDTVAVTCDKVEKPIAVRFGWVNFAKPELNFFNKDGLPAVPFRTDDFPLTTIPMKK